MHVLHLAVPPDPGAAQQFLGVDRGVVGQSELPQRDLEIASLSVSTATQEYFSATTAGEFEKVTVEGDAERLPHPEHLRLRITGVDPQLILPRIGTAPDDERLRVEMRLRVFSER